MTEMMKRVKVKVLLDKCIQVQVSLSQKDMQYKFIGFTQNEMQLEIVSTVRCKVVDIKTRKCLKTTCPDCLLSMFQFPVNYEAAQERARKGESLQFRQSAVLVFVVISFFQNK